MWYLALDSQSLMRLRYHWLWGLRIEKTVPFPSQDNLYHAAQRLQNNHEAREAIEEQLKQVSEYTRFFQMLCWVFNWRGYCVHYYQFQAYLSLQLYEEKKMFDKSIEESGPQIIAMGAAILLSAGWLSRMALHAKGMAWFSERVKSYFFLDTEQSNSFLHDEDEEVPITENMDVKQDDNSDKKSNIMMISIDMIRPLATLGIIKPVGTPLSHEELKKAYRAACLKTHPDKKEDKSDVEFKAVQEAYERMLSIVQEPLSAEKSFSEMRATWVAMLRRDMDEIRRDFQKIREHNERQLEELGQNQKRLDKIAENLAERRAKLGPSTLTQEELDSVVTRF